jgi:CubicO group peptidase (beta-lactamase class C family)
MILVDRGLLSLSDTVDKYYPEFAQMRVFGSDETVDSITVEQLLTHTSGIGSGDAWAESLKVLHAEDKSSVESFRAFLSNQPLSFVPGTKQEYSGIGAFSVLTAIIQKISGMTYAEFLKKEIFEPCKMINTTFSPSAEQWQKLIEMHGKRADKNAIGKTWDGCVFEAFPPESYLGGAGLISSIADYLNFAKMLVSRGEFEGKRIISEAAVSELSKPRFNINDVEWWGLGVRVITGYTGSPIPLGAYGWSGAYGTHFWVDPENKIIGIYMKNSRYDGGSGAVTSKNFEIDVYSSLE